MHTDPVPPLAPPEAPAVKAIAFYLPQFHPTEENDRNWGKGFTEWTNVTRAKPLYQGHHQPQLPADLGFYDLRVPEVMDEQAALAQRHGLHGFCYYHYWFSGRKLLHMPIERMLASGKPGVPYCLCWANENWTRRWDGRESELLFEQRYSEEDDLEHIRYLLPFLHDPRYIRVAGKPLLLMYRTEHHPGIARAAEIWRREAMRSGLPGLYLARVENFTPFLDPAAHGFDAGVEFAPVDLVRQAATPRNPLPLRFRKLLRSLGVPLRPERRYSIRSMRESVEQAMRCAPAAYTRFRCVAPSWDNTARRGDRATIYSDASPELFETWTRAAASFTRRHLPAEAPLLFVNAWNEWAEGCHLEPCQRWGHSWLESMQRGLAET